MAPLTGLAWILAAGAFGFVVSFFCSGKLRLSRDRFLAVYLPFVALFFWLFLSLNRLRLLPALAYHWPWGIALAALASAFLVRNVRSQPFTRQLRGAELAFDLGWSGLLYGLADALLLNVLPVMAVTASLGQQVWAASLLGKVAVGLLALLASLLVTWAYHWGYSEYRGRPVLKAVLGNGVITLAFLLSNSPLGSLISHTIMHLAAVMQGPETTAQLPPHYQPV